MYHFYQLLVDCALVNRTIISCWVYTGEGYSLTSFFFFSSFTRLIMSPSIFLEHSLHDEIEKHIKSHVHYLRWSLLLFVLCCFFSSLESLSDPREKTLNGEDDNKKKSTTWLPWERKNSHKENTERPGDLRDIEYDRLCPRNNIYSDDFHYFFSFIFTHHIVQLEEFLDPQEVNVMTLVHVTYWFKCISFSPPQRQA